MKDLKSLNFHCSPTEPSTVVVGGFKNGNLKTKKVREDRSIMVTGQPRWKYFRELKWDGEVGVIELGTRVGRDGPGDVIVGRPESWRTEKEEESG